jgi:hypothetical protein
MADPPLVQAWKYRVLDLEIGPDTAVSAVSAVSAVMAAQFSSDLTTSLKQPLSRHATAPIE